MQSRRGRKPPVLLTPEAARARAIQALSRREHGAQELTRKLAHQGAERTEAVAIVGALGESGWQSDARYAGLVTRSRIEQGYGPLRVRAELSARGIDDALIRAALDEAAPDWLALVRRVHDRRYRLPPESPKERASRYRFLATRGFTSAQIGSTLGDVDDGLSIDDDPDPGASDGALDG